MNTQSITSNEQPAIAILVRNPTILELCAMYKFDGNALAFIADVDKSVVHAMFAHLPVHKAEAKKVLAILSELLREERTFENTEVALIDEGEGEGKQSNGRFAEGYEPTN